MVDKTVVDMIILSMAFGSAFGIHSYESLASMQGGRSKGWPIGSWLTNTGSGNSNLGLFATATIFLSLGISFYLYSWWSPIVVVILGIIFETLCALILKARVQIILVLGTFAGFILCPYVLSGI